MVQGTSGSGSRNQDSDDEPKDPRVTGFHHAESAIGGSRFLIGLAIFGTSLSALAVLIYGVIAVFKTIWQTFEEARFDVEESKHFAVELIELTDIFLFGMVLYVVAIGMYQLFINPEINVPAWMRVESLADLKNQLINVIVVLLAVSFLAIAVSWTSDRSILYYGLAIGAVILSLAGYNLVHHRLQHDDKMDNVSE